MTLEASMPSDVDENVPSNFEWALAMLKQGYAVARHGWNGKNQFIYFSSALLVDKENIRNGTLAKLLGEDEDQIAFGPHIDMRTANGTIVVGWLASQTDLLENDWFVATK